MATTYAELTAQLQTQLAATQKVVNIEISTDMLSTLKTNNYKLCFAKKIGDEAYNVVWQSYSAYLADNVFSWTPQFQIFGTNTFADDVTVKVSTTLQTIGLGQQVTMDPSGVISSASDGGPSTSLTFNNDYGSIHPGVNQVSTGIDGTTSSTPIYVAVDASLKGSTTLTPVEKVMVWFEQNMVTSTMFSTARAKAIELDLTAVNSVTALYTNEDWTIPPPK